MGVLTTQALRSHAFLVIWGRALPTAKSELLWWVNISVDESCQTRKWWYQIISPIAIWMHTCWYTWFHTATRWTDPLPINCFCFDFWIFCSHTLFLYGILMLTAVKKGSVIYYSSQLYVKLSMLALMFTSTHCSTFMPIIVWRMSWGVWMMKLAVQKQRCNVKKNMSVSSNGE